MRKIEFENKIKSFEEYVSLITEITKPYNGKLLIGERLLYRGQSDSNWELLPYIARTKKSNSLIGLLDYERNLIEEAKYRLPSVFGCISQPIDLLALLQHYGISTRLLDVTANPLVALFFACKNNKKINECADETDGEVVVFKRSIEHNEMPPIHIAIAESYRIFGANDISLRYYYEKFKNLPYVSEQLPDLEIFINAVYNGNGGSWIKNCCGKTIFVQAQEQSVRQKLQQGEYILFPNKIDIRNDNPYFVNQIDPIPKEQGCIEYRIIIDKNAKESIIKLLNAFGINNGFLFADSIEQVCEQIMIDISTMVPR